MSAVAEVLSTDTRASDPRGCDLPTCPVCADSMVAALSLDLRHLRLRFRDQARAAAVRL